MVKAKFIFFLIIIIGLNNHCKQDSSVNQSETIDSKKNYPIPVSVISKNPQVIQLNKSEVQKIEIPTNKKLSFKLKTKEGIKQINLIPPASFTPNGGVSGGLSHFNTFSTEQGLSISSIACGYLDRSGNLWFGTYGGGVNKYDGKSFTIFNSSHGLANNLVLCIKEDQLGNIWFGTQGGGVSMYNGKSFTTFNILNGLADNIVYSILEDKNGNLWFATKGGGVSKYIHNVKNNGTGNNSTVQNKTSAILFKTYSVSNGMASNTIRAIIEDKQGNLWFGTEGDGVSKYDGNNFTTYNTTNGLASNTIWSIKEDYLGNIWFGTNGSGVSKYDGNRVEAIERGDVIAQRTQHDIKKINGKLVKSFTTFNSSHGLANNIIWTIAEDKKRNLWFGSEGGGVSVYHENNHRKKNLLLNPIDSSKFFTTYNTSHGLSNNVVFSITEDKSGNIWFGTYGGGISRFNGDAFVTFNAKQGLASNVVFSIAEDKNHCLWFGSYGGGATKYDGKSFTKYTTSQGLANNTIWAITKDSKDNLWFGTYGNGVSKYDGNSFTNYNTSNGLPHNIVRCIKEDKHGNIWFGTEGGGISKFDGLTFTNYNTSQGLPHNSVRCICEDKDGNLWFGTEGSGVSKFDGKHFTNYNSTHGLINNVVRSICRDDDGNLWFATQAGISCLIEKTNNSSIRFLNYSTANGLPDNYITQIIPFNNHKIIVGTNSGIAIFNALASIKSIDKLVGLELYNVSNNYPVKDVNVGQNAIYIDSKGVIWAGTGDDKTSLVRIDYNLIEKNFTLPKPEIHAVKINEQKIDWYSLIGSANDKNIIDSATLIQQQIFTYGKILAKKELDSIKKQYKGILFSNISKFYALPQNLILPYEHNSVTIEFNAIELSKNFLINYQYMLEGYDKNWSPVLKKTEASFGNINEGDYTFKLKAQSPNGIWSEPVTFKFKLLPPYYRTIWAYLFYIIGSIFILWSILRRRAATFKKRQKELEKIVEERTVEVILQKEEAEYQKELVQEKQKEILDSIHYAQRIQQTLLAGKTLLNDNLNGKNNYFVLFKPKDIVSGDFYWATKIASSVTAHELFYLAVCDSTGHGVPGAFMSLLNIGFLSEAIKEKHIYEPNKIFDYVRQKLIESISSEGQKDGFDGILICINKTTKQISYAASNNSPILVTNNNLSHLPLDKMPVGKGEKIDNFQLNNINYKIGDMLYLYTDGYPDQFGGPKGKKFKYKPLAEILLANSHLSLNQQSEILDNKFNQWKGDLEQVDDVLVIGIKI